MNWDAIRKEYETSDITLKALAEKHEIKLGTLKSRKSREGWERDATATATQPTEKVAKPDDVSWIDIENEYVTDVRRKPCTLKQLSEKHNISFDRIKQVSAERKWTEKREKHYTTTAQKTAEKSAELLSDDLSKVAARHFAVSDVLLSAIEKALQDKDELYKYVEKMREGYGPGAFSESVEAHTLEALNEGKVMSLANTLDKLQKMQRQTLGMLDAKDQHKVEMDKRKAGDDQEEYESDGFIEALDSKMAEVWGDD